MLSNKFLDTKNEDMKSLRATIDKYAKEVKQGLIIQENLLIDMDGYSQVLASVVDEYQA